MILPRYWTEADIYEYEERAGILEFCAGLDRTTAENRALRMTEARVRERMRDGRN